METNKTSIDVIKGDLPKEKKVTYEWEKKDEKSLEPWHFSTIALVLDLIVLCMYLFVNIFVGYQVPIGLGANLMSIACIIGSYIFLKKKVWAIGVVRYTHLINIMAILVTIGVSFLTYFIGSNL